MVGYYVIFFSFLSTIHVFELCDKNRTSASVLFMIALYISLQISKGNYRALELRVIAKAIATAMVVNFLSIVLYSKWLLVLFFLAWVAMVAPMCG